MHHYISGVTMGYRGKGSFAPEGRRVRRARAPKVLNGERTVVA